MGRLSSEYIFDVNERIFLRPLTIGDAQQSLDLINKNRERLAEWLPWVAHVKCIDDELNFIKSTITTIANGTSLEMGLFERNTSTLMGMCCFVSITGETGYIGYWLGSDHTGKGIITKACRKLIEIGFQQLNLKKIIIHTNPANKNSQAVAERLNFITNGKLQPVLYFGSIVDMLVYEYIKPQ
ncbi:putative ribosomal N-acetyltransferase YdaF [Ciona intestinalis]